MSEEEGNFDFCRQADCGASGSPSAKTDKDDFKKEK
jgi:hypothetical protein